jgi:enoyl-CoA hydratase
VNIGWQQILVAWQMINLDEVIVQRRGTLGHILLNRPKALNSVNLNMVRLLTAALDELAADDSVVSVLISGEGGKAFCAGGDIRELYIQGRIDAYDAAGFWRAEYPVINRTAVYPKPYIALMDGIVMGGGVGLSAHGEYRVVTDRTRLAMPETAIGFFPDVGATWLLANAPGESGTWLGLTSNSVSASDAIFLGLADYYCPHERLPDLIEELSAAQDRGSIESTLSSFHNDPPPSELATYQTLIDEIFSRDDLKSIFLALASVDSDFAKETLAVLQSRSPTSLKLTLRLLRAARQSTDLRECLEREYHAGLQALQFDEFYEGVRAVVIDKDRNAKWDPPTIDGVDDAVIETFFPRRTGTLVF